MNRVVISEAFSVYPMGRTDEDGPDNGERFFNEFIAANLTDQRKTVIVFDGVRAFGSSFLDQVFNVIPSRLGLSREKFRALVEVEAIGRAYQFYKNMANDFSNNIPR
tara:strand:- start:2348 stop:2668 length:321 start_codon:yes stop_codon:yes gene_type:complete